MKLRNRYILLVVLLHGAALAMSYFIFEKNKLFFLLAEAVVLVSLWLSWSLYRKLIQPLKLLMQGIEAIRDKDFNVKFRATGKHEMDQLIGVYNQMIDQLRAERVQQEEQHFFLEKLIQTSPTGIIVLDYDNGIHQVNPKAASILGMDEKSLRTAGHEHPLLRQILLLEPGASRTVSLSGIATYKIEKSHFIDRGFPRHFIMISELTAEILEAEKKVYEKVIRMMAHEVNNTVGPVNSIMQLALDADHIWKRDEEQSLKEALGIAISRNEHLNGFMRHFADLVKLPKPQLVKTDLNTLVRSVARLMEPKANDKNINIRISMSESSWFIPLDEALMEQALINILKNSMEAMDEPGTIEIVGNISERTLTIVDQGSGISPEQEEHIFSPFFSTKKQGQGVGLTLVREILLGHGFGFSLKTYGERNTRFVVRL